VPLRRPKATIVDGTVASTHQQVSLPGVVANFRVNENSTYLVRFLVQSSR
jgi:hypothetical protein